MDIIDSHCHIYGEEFAEDFQQLLERAREAGVNTMIAVGADLESSYQACDLAGRHGQIYCSVGIHPHDADGVTEESYREVRELALTRGKVVAIGEIGLDFFRDRSSRSAQEEVFRRFIRMARELSLPLIIHDRDAHDRIMAILKEENASEVGGVLHCFSGDLDMARECIEMGFKISIPGTLTYPSNEALREVVRGVKIEHLMVETDAPYLTPVPHRGKRNEPSYVRLVVEKIAELKGLSAEDVARITSFNTRRLFGIEKSEQNATIAYMIRNSLYLNITNRCTNRCTFCPKFEELTVKGHELKLSRARCRRGDRRGRCHPLRFRGSGLLRLRGAADPPGPGQGGCGGAEAPRHQGEDQHRRSGQPGAREKHTAGAGRTGRFSLR